jgi:hypothetical protein
MTSRAANILLRHNLVALPPASGSPSAAAISTVMMNLSYYGYALSFESFDSVAKLNDESLTAWWSDVEPELKSITGDNLKISDFVVYKNFPTEVLDKTDAEYWLPQILMYWGFPKEYFTEEVKPREKMSEQPRCTVLKMAKSGALQSILDSYLQSPARWKDQELQDVLFLSESLNVDLAKLAFKENLVSLATFMMANGKKIKISTATDVLRLAVGLSDGDVSLREKTKFKSFSKPARRYLLSMLEGCYSLVEDVARRPELWKRLLHQLHPGDNKRSYPNVCMVQDALYRGQLVTFNSSVEKLLLNKNAAVLDLLSERPGEFRRRLVHTLELFGDKTVEAFTKKGVIDALTTAQVVSLRTYMETVNTRLNRTFPPKGNWSKFQISDARLVDDNQAKAICKALGAELAKRIPKVKFLDDATSMIKLPSNDGEVSPYNRGTVFPIPADVEFIRTASYWQGDRTVWFDNGWNFFDKDWVPQGACSYSEVKFPNRGYNHYDKSKPLDKEVAAVFSGDPVNSKDMEGKAAQLIDLYPSKLLKAGVRYAVWSVLCYSRIPFSKVKAVFAALQWGKDPTSGNLFEPSRCQLQFPLNGESLTKYICLIDLEKRELVYLDANLHGDVSTASYNGATLQKNMPPFMEYIRSLPSVHDLFRESVDENSTEGTQILYSDKEAKLNDVPAYVFRPENKESKYKTVDINNLLA